MTPEEIKNIIAEELKAVAEFKNVYGVDLTIALIEPVKQIYVDSVDQTREDVFWTVLEETPDKKGYKIFFDEEVNMFGLGMTYDDEKLIEIGYHGSFLKTLKGM